MENEHNVVGPRSEEATQTKKMTLRKVWLAFEIGLVLIGGTFLYFVPAMKWWGGIIVLVAVGCLMVWRFIDIIAPVYSDKLLPYIIATFLAVVPFIAFGHGLYQLVPFIIYCVIIGVTSFYWCVWAAVSSFREVFLDKKRS